MDLSLITARREAFQASLQGLVGNIPVYYMPPENIKMTYPCFVIELDKTNNLYADGHVYNTFARFILKYITRKVDDEVVDRLFDSMKYMSFDRVYTAANLRHYVFKVHLV